MCERDIQIGRQSYPIYRKGTSSITIAANKNRVSIAYWGGALPDVVTMFNTDINFTGGTAGAQCPISRTIIGINSSGKTGDSLHIAKDGSVVTGAILISSQNAYPVYSIETILDVQISPVPSGLKE